MSTWLQILLGLSIAVITAFLVPFLLQVRRTAAAVERLADSATRDLGRMAEDIHQTRMRVEEVSELARHSLEHPATLTKVLAGVIGGMSYFFRRPGGNSEFLESLLTGLRSALNLFHRPKTEPEEECHE